MSNFIELNVYYKSFDEIDKDDIFTSPDYLSLALKVKDHRVNQLTINSNEIRFFEPTCVLDPETGDEMPLTKIVLKRKDCFFYIFTDMPYEELKDKVIVTKKWGK